ncbi:hypothetical protein [Bradyrhizobium elkanii]|uniref:hypothetical protein n=1 Tax=Bradyrhizobium elkanii TaxID=29448 RepID=UPI0008420508|nr:hypothetical protein [Bradyrhizobium elkanii]ODM77766.1 hypothetical protein A6452_34380 [Bradyrhizobium elkanii]ODM81777.1 hypothetical protein A6X20_19130 [Bradyrhizobium elkanii]
MSRATLIPPGLWPPRMPVEMAAGYCGEGTVEAFLREVRRGTYPPPVVKRGRRQIWLTIDLDRAIKPSGDETAVDVAADL